MSQSFKDVSNQFKSGSLKTNASIAKTDSKSKVHATASMVNLDREDFSSLSHNILKKTTRA